jgi:ATP-dependent Clp protease ATP-binding subunit ClpA
VGRGGGGGLDVSNLIKPPLARGELQCIGATTVDEHRKYIERDAALERRWALELLWRWRYCRQPLVRLHVVAH